MNTKKIVILSFIFGFLAACGNKEDDVASATFNSIEIDGEAQIIESSTPAFLSNLTAAQATEEGLALSLSYNLSDGTFISIFYYNNDENASNVILGDYTTDFDQAVSNTEFKYFYVTALNVNQELFISIDDNYADDLVQLIKSDLTSETTSGDYEVTLTNPQNEATMHLKGSFRDVPMISN